MLVEEITLIVGLHANVAVLSILKKVLAGTAEVHSDDFIFLLAHSSRDGDSTDAKEGFGAVAGLALLAFITVEILVLRRDERSDGTSELKVSAPKGAISRGSKIRRSPDLAPPNLTFSSMSSGGA